MTHPKPTHGAISTSHHLATEAGAAALKAGGNAIDAALAAAATLCVVYPHNVALGGDLVALVQSPDGRVRFLNATGTSASQQSLDALRAAHGAELPLRGIDTVTIPGGVRGWEALHELGASLSWSDHLQTAISCAEQGVPVSRSLAIGLADESAPLGQDAGCRGVFFSKDEPMREGDLLVQKQLATTLQRLAQHGPDEFYAGTVAEQWVEGLQALGSKISLSDTANYAAEWGEPLEGNFAGHRILTGPPNTSGFGLIRALNAVTSDSASTFAADPLGCGAGHLAEAFRASNAVRAAFLGDPSFGAPSGVELIEMAEPPHPLPGQAKPTGDTVGLSAVSADGWAVSLINSVYFRFGACILEPQTGIIFQNRGNSFSLDESSPNVFEPGKRPRHTLMPVLVFKGDQLAWVPSTMGGSAQPQIHTHLLLRALAGASPSEATHAPRWAVDEPSSDGTITVTIESDVPAQAKSAIEHAGFELRVVPPHTEVLGHSNLIRVELDGYTAASDPRSDGSALVVGSG